LQTTTYTDEQIRLIVNLKKKNTQWKTIADIFEKSFDIKKSTRTLTRIYNKYKDHDFTKDEMVSNIKSQHSTRKRNSKLTKEVRALADTLNNSDELITEIKRVIEEANIEPVAIPKPPKASKSKTNLAIELLISDIHVGIKTPTTNTEITRKRIAKIAEVALEEVNRLSKNYNITKIQLLLNGDIMQGNKLHPDSAESCESTDAEQMADAIRIVFFDLITPLAKTGIKIDIVGICGNHDRQSKDRPTVNPGRAYLTHTIYESIKMLTEVAKMKNISWDIPNGEFGIYEMFGSWFVVEHGHAPGIKPNAGALERQLLQRSNQVNKILQGIRIGHYHDPMISGLGRHIVNGSTVSDDHYGAHLGYKSYPCQIMSFYTETDKRSSSYYYSFQISLEEIGA